MFLYFLYRACLDTRMSLQVKKALFTLFVWLTSCTDLVEHKSTALFLLIISGVFKGQASLVPRPRQLEFAHAQEFTENGQ